MNDIAGRYRLLERLGSGNMGTVWRAFDERLRRTVAVKQVHVPAGLTGSQNDELVRRTMREGRIAARLQHPGLITVYDVVQDSGRPYLIMEHFPSKNLAALGTLPYPEAARIGTEAAEALAAAHESGVVHRDVKPANILVGTDGSVKITDFGISRVVEDLTATMTGMFAGTPAYLAPEVAKGDQATFASDVYSLGATLYSVIEGAPPAGSTSNPMGLLYRVASGDINPPKQAGPLTKLLTRLLSVDPATRPTMPEAQLALAANAADQSAIKVIAAKTVTPPKSTAAKTGKADKAGKAGAAMVIPPAPASPEAHADSQAVPESDTASAPETPSDTGPTSRASEPAAVLALAAASDSAGVLTPADAPTPAAESSPTPATTNQLAEPAPATGSTPAAESGPATGGSPATTPAGSDPTTGPASAASALAASASSTTSPDPAASARPNPTTDATASPAATPADATPKATTSPASATEPDSAATPDLPAGSTPTAAPASPANSAPSAASAPPAPVTEATPAAAGAEAKADSSMRKRLRAVAIGAGLVAVAVVAALVTMLVNTDDTPSNRDRAADQNANSAAPAADDTTTTTEPTTTTTTPAPTTTTTEQPVQPPPSTQQPNPPSSATPAAAIADYYALMPGNRDQAWNRLTPKFQKSPAGGKSGYDRFWSKISSISASGISQTGENVVEVTLLYVYNDGSRIQERHRYVLVNQNGTWLIDTVRVLSTSPA